MNRLGLFVAQGFGVGRCPWAPGTFGTVLGVPWALLLLLPGRLWVFVLGMVAGLALSVWLCGAAERFLGFTDPGSVVLDEMVAYPICLMPAILSHWRMTGAVPASCEFLAGKGLILIIMTFVAFRLLDILKPWPIRWSQRLPGGWGITMDDVLAAGGVALLSVPFVV